MCGKIFWQQPLATSVEAAVWEQAEGPAVLSALRNVQGACGQGNPSAAQRANDSPACRVNRLPAGTRAQKERPRRGVPGCSTAEAAFTAPRATKVHLL